MKMSACLLILFFRLVPITIQDCFQMEVLCLLTKEVLNQTMRHEIQFDIWFSAEIILAMS